MDPEFVNTQETGMNDDYIYLHCKCEYPLEFAWRFPRTNEEIIFTCPKCKTKMGIIAMKIQKAKDLKEEIYDIVDYIDEKLDDNKED